jgi:hypothetical protein
MGLGSLVGAFTGSGKVGGVNNSQVTNQSNQLWQSLLNSMQSGYDNEAKFRPQYEALNAGSLATGVAGVKNANPAQTDLLAQLTQLASQGLNNGGNDPALQHYTQQAQRGAEAARGMGQGPSDVVGESSALAQLWNTVRNQRQDFAGGVSSLLGQQQTMPGLQEASIGGQPTLTNSNQMLSLLQMIYGVKAKNAQQSSQAYDENLTGGINSLSSSLAMGYGATTMPGASFFGGAGKN